MVTFFGVSHFDVSVRSLAESEKLYVGVLGLAKVKSGEGWVDVESGAVRLRLIEVAAPERKVALRVQASDVDGAYQLLIKHGLRKLHEPMRTPDLEIVAAVLDRDGHTLSLWRELTEDEYGFEPDLPKEMTWESDAVTLLQSMLKSVPVMFRALARRKITKNAEWYAHSTRRVVIDHVVRAFIISNSKPTRSRVLQPLRDHGFNPDDYKDEFES